LRVLEKNKKEFAGKEKLEIIQSERVTLSPLVLNRRVFIFVNYFIKKRRIFKIKCRIKYRGIKDWVNIFYN
jgi:hypothetical protein